MKKYVTLLLTAALLTSLASCSGSDEQKPGSSTTAQTTTAAPKYDDDDLMINQYYGSDLSKYATIPALSDITVSAKKLQEAYEQEEKYARESFAEYKDTEEGYLLADGDKANIHYKGYSAGEDVKLTDETLASMTNMIYGTDGKLGAGHDLVIGSGAFIGAYESETAPEKNNPGFEEQLIGMKAGEMRTITVTFPDDYGNSEELRGVVIKFDVTVNSIKQGIIPELTDEMVAKYTSDQFKDIASFRKYIERYYTAQYAVEAISEASTFSTFPQELLDKYIKEYVYDYIDYMYGNTQLTDAEIKVIYDEQYNNAKKNAETNIKNQLILETLFQRLNITLTYAEYKAELKKDFEQYSFTYYYYYGLTTQEDVEEFFGEDYFVSQFKSAKLQELLPDHVTVVEAPPATEEAE